MREFIVQVCTVLLHTWDPVGVKYEPAAVDEYDSYAPAIAGLLKGNASVEDIAAHLLNIETQLMGLPGDQGRAMVAAQSLKALTEK